jgi:hypothetical protein
LRGSKRTLVRLHPIFGNQMNAGEFEVSAP